MNPEPRPTNSRPVSGMPRRLSKKRRRKSSNGRPPGRSLSSSTSSSVRAALSALPCAEIVTTAEETCWTSGARLGIGIGRLFGTCAVRFLSLGPGLRLGLRLVRGLPRSEARFASARRPLPASMTAPPCRAPSEIANARGRLPEPESLAKTHVRLRQWQHAAAPSPRRLRNTRSQPSQLSLGARVPGRHAAGRPCRRPPCPRRRAQLRPVSPRYSLKTREATIIDSRMIGTPI